ELDNYSSKQLNIKMQELKPYSPIIYGFSLRTVMAKYFYRINSDPEYKKEVEDVLLRYGDRLERIYRMLKEKYKKKMQEVFYYIDRRNFNSLHSNTNSYERFPVFIAQLALTNRSFIHFNKEKKNIDENESARMFIRKATQQMLRVD